MPFEGYVLSDQKQSMAVSCVKFIQNFNVLDNMKIYSASFLFLNDRFPSVIFR